jgi:hypothetical protein
MSKRSLIVLSVAALAACNGTDSNPAGVDPAFDQVVVSTSTEASIFRTPWRTTWGIFYRMERE